MDLFCSTAREEAVETLHQLTAIYTHEPIVDELLDSLSWPEGNRRLLDPSTGSGVFLCRALQRVLLTQPNIDDAHLVHVLQGWEVHPFAASQARSQVARILRQQGLDQQRAQALAELMVHTGDFLLEAPEADRFSAIATNPPYLRLVNVPEPIRSDYLATLPEHAQGDMLHAFLDRCAHALEGDGEIAMITSDRWLLNEQAAKLRETIGASLGVAHLERVDVASAFFRPKDRRRGTPARVHPVLVVLKRRGADGVQQLGREPIYPGAELLGECDGPLLGDVATVRIAPWLGTPGIFVVDQQAAGRFHPDELVPAVDTDDIANGMLSQPSRFALRTLKAQQPSAAVMAHLDQHLSRMCSRGRRPGTPWVPPESFENFDLSREHLLIPRIAKTLRPVRVPAGILPINHNISVISTGAMSLEDIQAALTAEQAQAWLRTKAPRLENGYYSITTRFLRGLPVAMT